MLKVMHFTFCKLPFTWPDLLVQHFTFMSRQMWDKCFKGQYKLKLIEFEIILLTMFSFDVLRLCSATLLFLVGSFFLVLFPCFDLCKKKSPPIIHGWEQKEGLFPFGTYILVYFGVPHFNSRVSSPFRLSPDFHFNSRHLSFETQVICIQICLVLPLTTAMFASYFRGKICTEWGTKNHHKFVLFWIIFKWIQIFWVLF